MRFSPSITHALILTSLFAVSVVRAEVAAQPGSPFVGTIILGTITDDPEPFGIWLQYRPVAPNQASNPEGHARGDGRPNIAYRSIPDAPNPTAFWPFAVWAFNTGSDHDIALAEWTGATWSSIEFLTASTDDDLDPRCFVEQDGTIHVVWWTANAVDRVFLVTRPAGTSAWGMPLEVAAGGRRPSVAVLDGVLRVSLERDSTVSGMAQDVVVVRRETGGAFIEEFVTSTARTEPLDTVLHVSGNKFWLDWKHGDQVFGCTEYEQGAWGAIEEPPWPEPNWIGVEETRKTIQSWILGN